MKKREGKDIWHGLYDFHLVERNRPVKIEKLLEEIAQFKRSIYDRSKLEISHRYKHILTHQIILAKFVFIKTGKFQLPEG